MISLAIVEDEAAYTQQLQQYLTRYQQESGETLEISTFTDGDEIVEG